MCLTVYQGSNYGATDSALATTGVAADIVR